MIKESEWEDGMLDWLSELGWEPGKVLGIDADRASLDDPVLHGEFLPKPCAT